MIKKALQLLFSNVGTGFHSHINDNYQSLLVRYNTRSKIALDIPLRKTNTEQQVLSFWGTKIWTTISHSTQGVSLDLILP